MGRLPGVANSSLRAGKKYRLTNYGEVYEFVILEIFTHDEFGLKDLYTLEYYRMSDLVRFGKGDDFSIWEI